MNLPISPIAVAALTAIWTAGALAAPELEEEDLALVYGDKSTVSIATGSPQALRRAPAVASVITAEDIAAMGAKDLDEVMETVPGVHVSHTANHYSPTYAIRGIYGGINNPQVLFLQNGIPMNTMYAGDKGIYWGGLPLENVARIEIIRGPGSALYGADAYSGVINIITKTAADTKGTEVGVRAGYFNSRDGWVQHGGQLGPVEVAAYVRVGSTDGQKEIITQDAGRLRGATLAPGPVNTGYDAIDASADFAYDRWRLRAGYKLRDNFGTGAGVSSALDPVGKQRGERITSDLSWNDPDLSRNWGAGFTGSYMHYAETLDQYFQLFPPGTRFPTGVFPNGMIGHPERYERHLTFSGYATYSGFSGHSLRFGVGHEDLNMYETATHKNYLLTAGAPSPDLAFNGGSVVDYYDRQSHILPNRRKIDYLYAQDEWNFAKDWTLTAGVRHDRYSDFGGTTNPRLALVWDATLDLTAKLLYGRAFRAPSSDEQYSTNPVTNGNPSLKPETIQTLEAAFSWQARRDTQLNLSLFRYEAQDLIRAVVNPAPAVGATSQNVGKLHGSGMEMEAVWDAGRSVRLTGSYSYQQSIDDASGKDAGYAPHHHFYVRSDWRFTSGWFTSAQINRVAERKRAAGDTRPQVPDYTTLDLTLRTSQNKNAWGFAASLRNLFDADVREPSLAPGTAIPNDLPMAPRSLWLQATYKL